MRIYLMNVNHADGVGSEQHPFQPFFADGDEPPRLDAGVVYLGQAARIQGHGLYVLVVEEAN